jgi:hypothetical protein
MTITWEALLYAVALVCLVLAAFGVGGRVALGWLGLAVWVLVLFLLAAGVGG